ncbi:MAG: hypothetical protein V3R35_03375 [Woeseiaceae bacterium]
MRMGRPRKSEKHLPNKVYHRHGAYYFVDANGKWIRLGNTPAEMYRRYADFVEDGPMETMDDVFTKYAAEVVPLKAERTQKDNAVEMKILRSVFGQMKPGELRPKHVYGFYNKRSQQSLACANREVALLSHVLTKAVEWGLVDTNICKQVRKHRPEPRNRYVEDWEYAAARRTMPETFAVAMDLIILTGLRPGDVLQLSRNHLTEQGILITPNKTRRARPDGRLSQGKALLIEWSDELRAVVETAKKIQPRFRQAIICNKQGRHYSVGGFNSIWYRYMRKAVNDPENPLHEPFQFRDLRAKSASDDTAEAATARLGHTSSQITERVYRRRARRVKPLR